MKTSFPSQADIARQWHVVDAEGKVLGRIASKAAMLLMGKHKPTYTPFLDTGDHVIVINAEKVRLTGKKDEQKVYRRHTGYPGGLIETGAQKMRATRPARMVELAISTPPAAVANILRIHRLVEAKVIDDVLLGGSVRLWRFSDPRSVADVVSELGAETALLSIQPNYIYQLQQALDFPHRLQAAGHRPGERKSRDGESLGRVHTELRRDKRSVGGIVQQRPDQVAVAAFAEVRRRAGMQHVQSGQWCHPVQRDECRLAEAPVGESCVVSGINIISARPCRDDFGKYGQSAETGIENQDLRRPIARQIAVERNRSGHAGLIARSGEKIDRHELI